MRFRSFEFLLGWAHVRAGGEGVPRGLPSLSRLSVRAGAAGVFFCLVAIVAGPADALSPELEPEIEPEADFLAVDLQADEALAAPGADWLDAQDAASAPDRAEAAENDAKAKSRERDKKGKRKSRDAAQNEPAAVAPPPPGKAAPPLFRIADKDTELWLLGSFHILPPGFDWRSPALGRALDSVDEIWFEAEVDTREAQETTMRILKRDGFNSNGARLTSLLSPEAGAKLGEVAAELKLPLDAIERMRPWQAFLALSVQFIASRGFEPGSGLEAGLLREARARGRSLAFLETVEQQLGLFARLKPKVEVGLLELTLAEWDTQAAEFDALFEAWRIGDVETIDRLMNAPMRERSPAVYEALLRGRNVAWAERLKAAMGPPGRRLIAVGAGHLAGPDSVQALMAAAGYSVEPYGETGPLPAPANDNAPATDAAPAEAAGEAPAADAPADDDLGALLETLETEGAIDF